MHHTQFIKMIIDEDLVKMNFSRQRIVYHSPCDLGRGSGVYEEPKEVLRHVALLEKTPYEDENSLCCGGSLGNLKISSAKKQVIARDAAAALTKNSPDVIATACPLCKKTFASATNVRVSDIAEIAAAALIISNKEKKSVKKIGSVNQLINI